MKKQTILLLASGIIATMISGCSSAPQCDDSDVEDKIIEHLEGVVKDKLVGDKVKNGYHVNGMYDEMRKSIKDGDLSDEEIEELEGLLDEIDDEVDDDWTFVISDYVTKATYKKKKQVVCTANATGKNKKEDELLKLKYRASVKDGELDVDVFGLMYR